MARRDIDSGEMHATNCPYCRKPAPLHELDEGLRKLTAVPEATARKLSAMAKLLAHKDARRCPSCRHVQLGSHAEPDMTCGECAAPYCFRHADAHPGLSCEEYLANTSLDPAYRRYAKKYHSKRCPSCMRSVIKEGGCDHMLCSCGHRFNWSNQPTEVPCDCLNLRPQGQPKGRLFLWGYPCCKNHTRLAAAKLVLWRTAVVAVAAPVVVPVVAVAVPVGAVLVARKHVKATVRSLAIGRHANGMARQYAPGSFEHTFYTHGCGRTQNLPRWLRNGPG